MTRDRQLDQLAQLARMLRDRELNRLSVLAARRQAARVQMEDCREDRRRALASAAADPAHIAGADGPWLAWNVARHQKLSASAALAAADVEAQLLIARRAFGRAEALGRIAERKQQKR
ncbi:MAG: hypothetical protein CMH12_00880 [Maritimibacter sp.]|nr:hypothetical protein [Maritimibacter sp.]